MDTLHSLLKTKMQAGKIGRQVQAALVVEFVNQLIAEFWGRKGAEQARAASFKSQTIKINCQNPIIAQEINFKKNRIIDLVNVKFDAGAKKIRVVQCQIDKDGSM